MASENETGVRSFKAGAAVVAFRRVKLSGITVIHAGANDDYIGITQDGAAINEQVPVKMKNFPGSRKVECAGAVASGVPVYAAASGQVDDAYTGGGQQIGISLEGGDGEGSVIEILPEPGGSVLMFNTIVQSGAGGTSSAAEFTFDNGSVTIPAGEIRAGDVYKITARGTLPATNGADTFTGRLKVGTEIIATTPLPDAVNDDQFIIGAEICIRVSSATGKLVATGYNLNDALVAGLDVPFGLAEATEDVTGAVAIAVTGQFSASSAGNEARLQQFSVERLRR